MALLLGVAGELFDFAIVKQEFSGPGGFVVSGACLLVVGDVHVAKVDFVVTADGGEAFVEADSAVADALDFGAEELHAGFEGFQD